jgi:DNA-directed RNA polymerase specialized sigma24 family protein
MMSDDRSVTGWLDQLQAGDPTAAQRLWERYFQRLVGLARVRLQGMPRRAADEEDVALSAFNSFFQGAGRGVFPQLRDRDNLWRLLVTLTSRKAAHLVRDQRRAKRGGGAIQGESAFAAPGAADVGIHEVEGDEPTPAFAAQVAEEFQRLLDKLPDAELRSIALWKMEGETNPQIAKRLGCALATVERRVALIRRIWEREADTT